MYTFLPNSLSIVKRTERAQQPIVLSSACWCLAGSRAARLNYQGTSYCMPNRSWSSTRCKRVPFLFLSPASTCFAWFTSCFSAWAKAPWTRLLVHAEHESERSIDQRASATARHGAGRPLGFLGGGGHTEVQKKRKERDRGGGRSGARKHVMGQLRGLAAGRGNNSWARWPEEKGADGEAGGGEPSIHKANRCIGDVGRGLRWAGLMCTLFTRCRSPRGT